MATIIEKLSRFTDRVCLDAAMVIERQNHALLQVRREIAAHKRFSKAIKIIDDAVEIVERDRP